jgi:hypothetical protein
LKSFQALKYAFALDSCRLKQLRPIQAIIGVQARCLTFGFYPAAFLAGTPYPPSKSINQASLTQKEARFLCPLKLAVPARN